MRTSLPRDEVRRARHLDLELVGRDERQALVGVVGQEHGDDDHEHGRGADQHRVGGDAGAARPSSAVPRRGSRAAARSSRARRRARGAPGVGAGRRGRRGRRRRRSARGAGCRRRGCVAALGRRRCGAPASAGPCRRSAGGGALRGSRSRAAPRRASVVARTADAARRSRRSSPSSRRPARRVVGRARVDDQPGAQVVAERVEAVDRGRPGRRGSPSARSMPVVALRRTRARGEVLADRLGGLRRSGAGRLTIGSAPERRGADLAGVAERRRAPGSPAFENGPSSLQQRLMSGAASPRSSSTGVISSASAPSRRHRRPQLAQEGRQPLDVLLERAAALGGRLARPRSASR